MRHLRKFGHEARHGVRRVYGTQGHIEEAATDRPNRVGLLAVNTGMDDKVVHKVPNSLDKRHGAYAVDPEENPARLSDVLVQTSFAQPERILRLLAGRPIRPVVLQPVRRENRPEPTESPSHREEMRSNSIGRHDKTG